MSAIVRALEDDIFQLCERVPDKQTALEKQRLYSRVGQFLMGSFDGHWWCRYPTLMTFMVRILELHPGPDSVRLFYDKMAQQLGLCRKCVDIYHSAMPSVRMELESEFTPTSVKAFFHKVSQLDAERLQALFTANPTSTSTTTFNLTISTAFYEILSNQRLWSDFRLIRVVSKWLAGTPEPIKEAAIDKDMILRRCPGILQWLVSPDPGIRAWATSLVGKYGIVVDMSGESSDGRAWMKVLDEWMYILESGLFNTSLLNLDLPSTEELPMFLDVTNCVKTPTNQTLWAALDTIMQRMNETSLEALLESFDNLPDLVFNYLNDAEPATTNPQVTFVICKCYGSLLRCLGHRYWNHTVQSPKVVLDLVLQHCLLPSWRVFVTKQLIDLLPALVASMRPQTKSTNDRNQSKLSAYFQARSRVLKVLLHGDHRPSHFNDQVLCVSASKAVSTIICDCYEPRLASNARDATEARRDDGALPETSLVDLSVIESSYWWPCGVGYEDIEQMWINHLFRLLVNPDNIVALVDHVALTCSTVLMKHLSLAREIVYTAIKTNDESVSLASIMPAKPIITKLLERLCSWGSIATIPIAVHGALFESIGGIAEVLNVIEAQQHPIQSLVEFKATLKSYEALVSGAYLERISDEVLVKGLTNPLRFPVVAQHLTVCLLSPNSQPDQRIKRLLAHAGANKATPDRIPPPLESLLVVVHRNTEAYLRGVLNLLQGWRLHDFALPVILPTVKKVIFAWTKIYEMLGNDLKKAMEVSNESSSQNQHDDASKIVNLQKVPVLMGDFVVRLLSDLYSSKRSLVVEEATLVQCLDFGNVFWRFFAKEDKTSAFSKRYEGMVAPLTRCVESVGGQAEKRRAAELLMTLVEGFVEGQTRINDASITKLEALKPSTMANIESKKSTDFARVATKLRQVSKASWFFSPRPVKARRGSRSSLLDLEVNDRRTSPSRDEDGRTGMDVSTGMNRPMSGKSAAREQARLAAARSAASTIFEASSKKSHSFYDEDEFVAARTSSTKTSNAAAKPKTFNISQVMKGMDQARPGVSRTVRQPDGSADKTSKVEDHGEEDEEDEEEDATTNLAPVFFKIKNTQKAIPSSTLVPFFRHLLQVCMPALLTKEFDIQQNDRELVPPPLTFGKSSEYANAFLPLLLEECHNEIREGLRQCYFSSKSGHLLRYESEKPREGMRCMSFSVVESNGPSSGKSRPGDKFFRREKLFRNADVVLLRSAGNRQNAGNLDFIGVVVVSENDKERRRQGRSSGASGPQGGKADQSKDDQELIRIMFLNDGELESVTSEVPTFQMEALTANVIADTEWRVTTLGNLVTSSREYVALRCVDMLPEHFRTTILTPNVYETTQTDLLKITAALDELRVKKSGQPDIERKILKLLKRLDRMEVSLTDLRSTSIGKTVNKLRKHDNAEIKVLSNSLKDKWTALMDKKDALDVAPRYVSSELWDTIKGQYNQSQLQSIHSVLNNYNAAISLLQGPPGTGKTKTIMGLLSGFLTLRIPPAAVMPQSVTSTGVPAQEKPSETLKPGSSRDSGFSNFDLVREIAAKQAGAGNAPSTFSLSGTSAASRILRHSDSTTQKPTTIQALKSVGNARSRLESKMTGNRPSSAAIVRRTLLGPSVLSMRSREYSSNSSNVLLCAPSNGAVDELVLRIVTDGLLDRAGKVAQVRAPSVHPDANTDGITIVRLGNPGEDAPDVVKAVCLPHIIKLELSVHPKAVELRNLQEQQRAFRSSIREFYDKKQEEKAEDGGEDKEAQRKGRRELAKTHADLTQVMGKIRRLRDEVSALEAKMTAAILSSASIIACTLSKAGSGQFDGLQRGFDALIVDEAAQAVELSTLIPIRERVARAVLVGDPKQLPATVKSVVAAKARYDRSLFERIADSGVAPSMLRVQYRMHPFLREFPSKQFYGGMLTDGPTVMERVNRVCGDLYKKPYFQPFLLFDLVDTRESDSNGSKYNPSEAAFCVDLCSSLFEICPALRVKKWSVGFVSPYREQVATIRKEISRCSRLPASVSVEVNTVDGFQGREKDVIIFSCVRASDRGGIGFLKDIRRLNVGITRARFCLFVVGSVRTLRRDETWNALVRSAEERKLIIQAKASSGFAAVKEELDRDRRGLIAHYEEMHEKLVNKKGPTATQQSVSTTPTTGDVDTVTSGTGTNKDPAVVPSEDASAKNNGKSEEREGSATMSPTRTDSSRSKREHEPLSASQPAEKRAKVDEMKSTSVHGSSRQETSSSVSASQPGKVEPANRSEAATGISRTNQSRERRSRSRNRDDRASPRHLEGRENALKRPAPPLERDAAPNKTTRVDDRRYGRSRSRSRSRPRSSSARRESPTLGSRERPSSVRHERPQSDSRERSSSAVRERPSSASRDRPSSGSRQEPGRQNSRSRERPSSATRRENPGSDSTAVSRSTRLLATTRDANDVSRTPGVVREKERTAEQKHLDRQARLRALRETADARAGTRPPVGVGGSGRIVQLVRTGSGSSSVSRGTTLNNAAGSSGRSGGSLLNSILGSSKQLAKATSRVDLASARRDHTG